MPIIERETVVERPARNETVVVGGGGNPFAVIGAIVVALLVVGLLIWLFNGGLSGGAVNVDLPEVTVTD